MATRVFNYNAMTRHFTSRFASFNQLLWFTAASICWFSVRILRRGTPVPWGAEWMEQGQVWPCQNTPTFRWLPQSCSSGKIDSQKRPVCFCNVLKVKSCLCWSNKTLSRRLSDAAVHGDHISRPKVAPTTPPSSSARRRSRKVHCTRWAKSQLINDRSISTVIVRPAKKLAQLVNLDASSACGQLQRIKTNNTNNTTIRGIN